jgi:hypothetical protein
MVGLETRIARLEEAKRDDGDGPWRLPFFSRVREASETNYGALLTDWELSRRIAFLLAHSRRNPADEKLMAARLEWEAILWPARDVPELNHDGSAIDGSDILQTIRDRLREVLIDPQMQ